MESMPFTLRWRAPPLQSAPATAQLRIAADFCTAEVFLNDIAVCTIGPNAPTLDLDVTQALKSGTNSIRLQLHASNGPAAVALSLTAQDLAGLHTLNSDRSWTTDPATTLSDLGPVPAELWGLGRTSIALSSADNYEQWRQASKPANPDSATPAPTPTEITDARLRIAPGFQIQRIRTAAANEGSWVSLAFDETGRLTIAREDQGLLRFPGTPAELATTAPELINTDLLECRGLLYAHNALYANANNSKALYRLRDLDGNGSLEDVRKLREYSGGVGHGRNDLALGPDGWIWAIHGDSVDAPPAGTSRDITSPLRDSRRGPPRQEGYVVRISPDGSQSEVVCTGLRNPYGLDFNPDGAAFTWDADNEFDMGTPWYRPTRIWQLAPGLDFGWRVAQGQWPPYFPDRADNAVWQLDTGKSSPTSVMFGERLSFPASYQHCLYVLDWAYGRVLAVHMKPRGSHYRMAAELFLQGVPLNVTDLAAGPDGAMYLITGGRKTQSALYRITSLNPAAPPDPTSQHEQDCQRHAEQQRLQSRQAEHWLRAESPADSADERLNWIENTLLADDPLLRAMARTVLEQMPVELWASRFLTASNPRVFTEASLSLARAASRPQLEQLVQRMSQLASQTTAAQTAPEWLRQAAVRLQLIQELAGRFPDLTVHGSGSGPADFVRAWLLHDLQRCAAGPTCSAGGEHSQQLQYQLAATAAELQIPLLGQNSATASGIPELLSSESQQDQLTALLALRKQLGQADPALVARYFATLNGHSRYLAGDGMTTFVTRLREDALNALPEARRTEYQNDSPPQDNEPLTIARPEQTKWTVDSLLARLPTATTPDRHAAGAAVFREALCIRCHRFGTAGQAVGPELTYVGRRFSRQDLVSSIIEPSKVVAEPYRLTQIVTTDGLTRTGRLLMEGDYRSELIRLNTDLLQPAKQETIDKKQVETLQTVDLSPMPAGLLNGFTAGEISDLLLYLETGPTPTR